MSYMEPRGACGTYPTANTHPHLIHRLRPLWGIARQTLGRAQLTGELTESFLSKFAFSLGRGRVTATFYLTEPYLEMSKALNLYVFCDEEWAQWKQLYTCVDRVKLARQTRALTGATEQDIDMIFGWLEAMYSHKMQLHYESRFDRTRRSMVTSQM